MQERNSDATLLPRNESVEVKPDLRPQGRTISNRQNAEQPIVIIDSEDEASDVPQDAVPQEAVPQEAVHAHTQQQDSNLVPSGQCTACKQRDQQSSLYQCGSCNQFLHEGCAASLTPPLSIFCFFCPECKKQPHQKGALLEALASKGWQGGTVSQLQALVQKRQEACMDATNDTTISGLVGSSRPISQELAKMIANGDRNVGIQAEVASYAKLSCNTTYRLKMSEKEWSSIATAAQQGNQEQHDQPRHLPEPGQQLNMQTAKDGFAKAAAAADPGPAMDAATCSLLEELDARQQTWKKSSRKRQAHSTPKQRQATVRRKSAADVQHLKQSEEVQQLKQDKEELQQQLQAQKRQIASLEAAGHLQNASTEQPNRYSATDILDSLEHTPAQDLLKILQQTMQTLVDYTEELSDIEQPDDNEAVQVQEMLDALRPQLQGTDHAEWMRAISQLHGPLQDLKVEASLIPDLTAEVQTLKEACIFQHQPTLHKLASDVTDLCSSMKIWLSTLDNCSVSYHEKAGQLLQLQARKALCSRAYELMGRT